MILYLCRYTGLTLAKWLITITIGILVGELFLLNLPFFRSMLASLADVIRSKKRHLFKSSSFTLFNIDGSSFGFDLCVQYMPTNFLSQFLRLVKHFVIFICVKTIHPSLDLSDYSTGSFC